MTSPVPFAEVIGDPIAQSKSPAIHRFWLEALGIDADYRAERVGRAEFKAYLADRRANPLWRGCNVTMPLKLDALFAADDPTDHATAAGAANLLVVKAGRLVAAATTGIKSLAPIGNALMPECSGFAAPTGATSTRNCSDRKVSP